jgi:hypothetical protein
MASRYSPQWKIVCFIVHKLKILVKSLSVPKQGRHARHISSIYVLVNSFTVYMYGGVTRHIVHKVVDNVIVSS